MSEVSTRSKSAATSPESAKHKGTLSPTSNPKAAPPEPIDAHDVLERLREIGVHWWSIIDSVLELHDHCQHVHPDPLPPLPEWAVNRLRDQGRHSACEAEFFEKARLLNDWLHIADGSGSRYRFEIWTSKCSRLAFRHESWQEAAEVLRQLKPTHPDAFIARIHIHTPLYHDLADNAALLDTFIGRVDHVGTSFGVSGGEDRFTVQDETGRQATVAASVLRQHPVYERLNKRGKESLDFSVTRQKQRQGELS